MGGITRLTPLSDTELGKGETKKTMAIPDSDLKTASVTGPKWDLYRYFLSVAKTESITSAAQLLRESSPTVSRRIRELETHFRDALFRRSQGGLYLTPAGVRLQERLDRVDMDLATLQSEVLSADEDLKGHVTIAAPRGFGKAVLLDCIGELRREMPEVTFTAIFRNKKAKLSRREADIAVRIGDPDADGMTAQHVGEVTFGIYASASFLNSQGAPTSLSQLQSADYVGLAGGENLMQIKEMQSLAPHLSPSLSVDCILLQAQTVALGFGFAPLPEYITASFPGLVRILPGTLTQKADIWVLSQPNYSSATCVHATVRSLVAATQSALAIDAA